MTWYYAVKQPPLITLCFKMIANGIVANVKGKDLGDGLIKLVERLHPKNIVSLRLKLGDELNKIRELQTKRGVKDVDNCTAVLSFQDKIECLEAFAENAKGIAELKRNIEAIFSDTAQRNAIMLSTVHKSKGLEADRVFIILPDKLPLTRKGQKDWEIQQEMNLKYVAITRAKKMLAFVNLTDSELKKYDFKAPKK